MIVHFHNHTFSSKLNSKSTWGSTSYTNTVNISFITIVLQHLLISCNIIMLLAFKFYTYVALLEEAPTSIFGADKKTVLHRGSEQV